MMNTSGSTLGARIRERRLALDYTLEGLSDELTRLGCDVSHQTVSKWERDQARPRPDKLETIAEVLKVPLDDLRVLYHGSDREPSEPLPLGQALRQAAPGLSEDTYEVMERIARSDPKHTA